MKIVLGEGEGRNWWCVVFPPLCLGSVSETVGEKAFRPIGEDAFQRAVSVMERCGRVLCPVEEFGEMNEKNRRLRELARQAGKLEERAALCATV